MSERPDLTEAFDAFQRGDLDRARVIAERSAAAAGSSPKIEHLLGLIHARMGDPAAGADHFRLACEAEPDNPHHAVMLARALVDSGRAAEVLKLAAPGAGPASAPLWHARAEAAEACGDEIAAAEAWLAFAEARGTDARAWNNAGNTFAKLERWGDAAAALGKAVQLTPGDAGLRRNLATALGKGGWVEERVIELSNVVRLDPRDFETRMSLAAALEKLLRFEEALEVYEAAAAADRDRREAAIGRARSLVRLGRYDDAEAAYHQMLSKNPSDFDAFVELGLLLERLGKVDALACLLVDSEQTGVPADRLNLLRAAIRLRKGDFAPARALLLASTSAADPEPWYRIKAKIEDALGDFDEAFTAASAMNLAVGDRDEWRQRGADYRARLRNLHDVVTPGWAARVRPLQARDGRQSPVFLVGFPRSGTTLLDIFLTGHPEIEVLEEVHLVAEAEKAVGDIAALPDLPRENLQEARDAYFRLLDRHAAPAFAGIVVDKMPLNMVAAQLIHALFPDARFVFAQRHPCDCVLSAFMQAFLMNDAMASFLDLRDSADFYDAAMRLWTRNRQLFPLNVHTTVYERLVSEPESELRPLLSFLGLDWHDDLLDHLTTAKERGAIITPSYDQVTQPLHQRASGRWRRYEKQLEPVLPILLPWAEWLGYTE